MDKIKNYLLSLVVIFILSGCGLVQSAAPSRIETEPEIESVSPDILREYRAFYVAPIDVYSTNGDALRRVSSRETDDLAEGFRAKIIRELDSKYTSFSQPAKGVALLKIAISDISSTYAALQLRPGYVIPNSMRGGATIEAKFIDSVSGKVLLSYKDTEQGERQGYFSGLGKWDGAKRAFEGWAKELGSAVS